MAQVIVMQPGTDERRSTNIVVATGEQVRVGIFVEGDEGDPPALQPSCAMGVYEITPGADNPLKVQRGSHNLSEHVHLGLGHHTSIVLLGVGSYVVKRDDLPDIDGTSARPHGVWADGGTQTEDVDLVLGDGE